MENINGYYDLLVAIIVQAYNDFCAINSKPKWKAIPDAYKLDEKTMREFLSNIFSDNDKIDLYMNRAIELRDSGIINIAQKGEEYDS